MKETKHLEFKETISNTFLKTVSAFANFGTGKIIFGIDDEGKTVGISDAEAKCMDIENKINDSIQPKPDVLFYVDKKASTITLTVQDGRFKPYLYKGKAYKRSGTSTVEMDNIELKRLVLLGMNMNFEELEDKEKMLEFKSLFAQLKKRLAISTHTDDVLKTLGLINRENKLNNAGALIADVNEFPGIDIARFGSSINEILYRKTIDKVSIIKQQEEAEEAFKLFYRIEEIKGMKREERFLIPFEAFREAIANALVHRTWDVSSHIRIAMYADRIEIFSPGGLPVGMTEEEYINGYVSNLRNPIIANIFYRLGIIEMFGTGIRRIKDLYADIESKPIFSVTENSVKIVLPTVNKVEQLTTEESVIMDCLANGKILSSSEIVALSGFGKDKVLAIIESLLNKNKIEKYGNGRGRKYSKNI